MSLQGYKEVVELMWKDFPQRLPALADGVAPAVDLLPLLEEFQSVGVGPLTILMAYSDMLAMNKLLDQESRMTAAEISQQAGQLHKAFQKLTRKS